jgi:phosphotransferase system  glucose/maltose/N-acetylglucosamine-specific IIC component
MRVLLFSALLYLVGVVVVLFLKPKAMFNEDGSWKEFGLYNSDKYTWFPVWLFCIVWAIVSYGIVKFTIAASGGGSKVDVEEVPTSMSRGKKNLKPGYYVLNQNALESEGVPRYVYIGEEPPA